MTLSRGEDPYGGEGELAIPAEVMGVPLPPAVLPEDALDAGRKFAFGGDVARVFEELVIPRQIPGYKEMRYRLVHVAHRYLSAGTSFVDIGTSHGRMIRDVVAAVAHQNPTDMDRIGFYGVDFEQDMLDRAKVLMDQLRDEVRPLSPEINLVQQDLRLGLPQIDLPSSVIASVFVLQFIPMEHRPRLLKQIYDQLEPGGAFLLAEKVLLPSVDLDDVFTEMYYAEKARNGLSANAIEKKRASLEGYLVPLTDAGNVELMEAAGFSRHRISTFWQNLQFKAYLAVK